MEVPHLLDTMVVHHQDTMECHLEVHLQVTRHQVILHRATSLLVIRREAIMVHLLPEVITAVHHRVVLLHPLSVLHHRVVERHRELCHLQTTIDLGAGAAPIPTHQQVDLILRGILEVPIHHQLVAPTDRKRHLMQGTIVTVETMMLVVVVVVVVIAGAQMNIIVLHILHRVLLTPRVPLVRSTRTARTDTPGVHQDVEEEQVEEGEEHQDMWPVQIHITMPPAKLHHPLQVVDIMLIRVMVTLVMVLHRELMVQHLRTLTAAIRLTTGMPMMPGISPINGAEGRR